MQKLKYIKGYFSLLRICLSLHLHPLQHVCSPLRLVKSCLLNCLLKHTLLAASILCVSVCVFYVRLCVCMCVSVCVFYVRLCVCACAPVRACAWMFGCA